MDNASSARIETASGARATPPRDWVRDTHRQLSLDAHLMRGSLRAVSALMEGRDPHANDPNFADLACLTAVLIERMDVIVDNVEALGPHV